jgi:FAD/FMN-containing dehydrogenase
VPSEAPESIAALAARLEAIVGSDRVSLWPEAAIHDVHAPLEARPADEQQLTELLVRAGSEGLGICIAGGATKLGWGNRPDRFDLLLSTRDLSGFGDVDADNLSLSVAAGTPIAEARAKAREIGRLLPLDPGHSRVATVGGVTATGDQGARGAGYGGLRDVVLGLSAVLADGSRVRFGGRTMKNVTGYDVTKLFIGSFGVLGVITEVTYRLLPLPEKQALVVVPLASLVQGREIAAGILDSYLQPLALEVVSAGFAQMVDKATSRHRVSPVGGAPSPGTSSAAGAAATAPAAGVSAAAGAALADLGHGNGYLLLAAFAGHPAAVSRSVAEVQERSGIVDAAIIEDAAADSLFESLSDAGAVAAESGTSLSLRATVPISAVWELAQAADSGAGTIGLPPTLRIGAARGALDLYADPGMGYEPRTGGLAAYSARLRRDAVALGGQLVVTRGLTLLPDFDAWGEASTSAQLMRRLKERFDVGCILNPGRFVGGI